MNQISNSSTLNFEYFVYSLPLFSHSIQYLVVKHLYNAKPILGRKNVKLLELCISLKIIRHYACELFTLTAPIYLCK